MTEISYREARERVERLRSACGVLRKCAGLSPEDLKGKYRKAHERAMDEAVEAVNGCIMEVVPWGIQIWERNGESVNIWLREFSEGEEFRGRLEKARGSVLSGDMDSVMEFLRWLRAQMVELGRMSGRVNTGGEKILE